ncbi:hypothetical protein [Roseibium sediminis]|uniref:hypothetical protein n=1 Tax=Roseibium sediminis TaxID=1775174 RepID=UPI00123CC752|nr:hypothetical protein [Roseibium sediminis]
MTGIDATYFGPDISPDPAGGRGINLSTIAQTLQKSAILDRFPTEMLVGHALAFRPLECEEFINGSEQIVHHGDHIERNSVQVKPNERLNVSDFAIRAIYNCRMEITWLDRIVAAISLTGQSYRTISQNASLGPNFVSEMIRLNRLPKTAQLQALCDALDIRSSWVLEGTPTHPAQERLVKLVAHLQPEERLRTMKKVGSAKDYSFSQLQDLADQEGISLDAIQKALHFSSSDTAASATALEGAGVEAIAMAKDADLNLLMEIYQDVLDMEQAILGRRGRFNNRHELIREIYLKRTGAQE